MKILAFDLAWDGYTGWVYWEDEKLDPILRYGEFQPRVTSSKLKGSQRQMELCHALYELSKLTIEAFQVRDNFIVAVEQSDWHQSLGGKSDWKQTYSRERTVQRALGMAEGAFFLAVKAAGCQLYGIGAKEAKQEFGAIRKDAAARILANEHGRFEIKEIEKPKEWKVDNLYGNDRDGYFVMYDKKLNDYVAHHVSDAIVVASVVSRRLRQDELGNQLRD